ncbi:MAG: hypothetical protein MUC43_15550, partial [Pirellula sp.]|nr:hypothetical protein [Pirellula sp.]
RKRLCAQNEATVQISNRQGFESIVIPCTPPSLEIDGPHVVRSLRFYPVGNASGFVAGLACLSLNESRIVQYSFESTI